MNFLTVCIIFALFLFSLQMTRPPTMIKQPPQNLIYDERILVTLECEADAEPPADRLYDPSANNDRVIITKGKGTLTITQPNKYDDEGLYQCFAKNQFGTSLSNTVLLQHARLDNFPHQSKPAIVAVNNGDPLTLKCTPPKGIPDPQVFWFIDDPQGIKEVKCSSRISIDEDGNLNFAYVNATEDVKGDLPYTCVVNNPTLNTFKQGEYQIIKVTNPNDKISSRPPKRMFTTSVNTVALEGSRLALKCIYSGSPPPKITWRKIDGNLPEGRYSYECFSHDMVVENVAFGDAGAYECRAFNGVGEDKKRIINVQVQSVPKWKIKPENTIMAEEETLVWDCKAEGVPQPNVQWFINGLPISKSKPNERRKIEGSTMTIVNLKKDIDVAVYQCNASNIHGYVFADAYLNILAEPPTFTQGPPDILEVVDDSSANITCLSFGAPKPKVSWTKDGQEITGGRYVTLPIGNLYIEGVIPSDAGIYECTISNKFGMEKMNGRLSVKTHTEIQTRPQNSEIRVGEAVVFRCSAVSDPSLKLSIDWHKNDEPIDYLTTERVFKNEQDNSLTLTNAQESDTASYTCIASTRLDKVRVTANLTVQDVPNKLEGIKLVSCLNNQASISWTPMGDNSAPIRKFLLQYQTSFKPDEWINMEDDIPPSDRQHSVNLSPYANYTFRVIAENKIGQSDPSDITPVCQTTAAPPYKNPENVRGIGDEPNAVKIAWNPTPPLERNGPGFHYVIEYRPADNPEADYALERIDDAEQSVSIIPNQPVYKPFEVRVKSFNLLGGAREPVKSVVVYSGEDSPSFAVTGFAYENGLTPKSARFTWDAIDISTINGEFKGYKVLSWIEEGEGKEERTTLLSSNVTSAIIKTLKPFSENVLSIQAINNYYASPVSQLVRIRTPEGVPGMVKNFNVYPIGSNALHLGWQKPDEPNGILLGYRIFYSKVEGTNLSPEQEKSPAIEDPNILETKLVGLESNTKYRVIIAAQTRVGMGHPDWREEITMESGPPDKPSFYIMGKKLGLLNVTWIPSKNGNPGSVFYVEYKLKGDDFWQRSANEFIDDWLVISNLEEGKMYEVRVVAQNDEYITPSNVEEVRTVSRKAHDIATAGWFVGLMCAIAILLLIMIVICLIRRNRGGKYPVVNKNKRKNLDRDDADDGSINEFAKPTQPFVKRSRQSLNNSLKAMSEADSNAEYADSEIGKFDEDGSFIGQYSNKSKEAKNAAHAFV